MKLFFASLFFLCAFAAIAPAQTKFSSLDGGYIVELPAGAEFTAAGPVDAAEAGKRKGYFNRWHLDKIFFEAVYIDLRDEKPKPSSPVAGPLPVEVQARLEEFVQILIDKETAGGLDLISDRQLADKGRELLFQANSKATIYHISPGDGVLACARAFSPSEVPQLQTAFKFLNSLTIAKREEIVAQKIKDAAPAGLPQVIPAQWTRPDAEDLVPAGRGKVKDIVEEVEASKKDPGAPGKFRRAEYHFDAKGFLTQTISYDHTGHPVGVSVYGFIDGMRVNKGGEVQNERVFSAGDAMPPPRPGAPVKKRDTRYTSRVAEKYDPNKRVSERVFYDNAGDQILRSIYAYRNDGRNGGVEISEYKKTGTPDNSVSQTLDAKGNITQTLTRVFGTDPHERRTVYKYLAFDANGNWTKRTVLYELKRAGKIDFTSEYIEYRTITYYQ